MHLKCDEYDRQNKDYLQSPGFFSRDIDRSRFSADSFLALKTSLSCPTGIEAAGSTPNLKKSTIGNDSIARYLIAKDDDRFAAMHSLFRALEWKRDCNNWPIRKSDFLDEFVQGKMYVRGVDRDGYPLIVVVSRKQDIKRRDLLQFARMCCWWMEYSISTLPADKSRVSVLIDATDCMNKIDEEFLQYFSSLFKDLYPERVNRIYIYHYLFAYFYKFFLY